MPPLPHDPSSPVTSGLNLATSIVGAGVLGLPFAFLCAGWLLGSVLFVLSGALNLVALHVIAEKTIAAEVHGKPVQTFEELVRVFLGHRAYLVSTCMVVISAVGTCVAYLIIIESLSQPVVAAVMGTDSMWSARPVLILSFAYAIAFPLTALPSLHALAHSSLLAVLTVLVVGVVIVWRSMGLWALYGGSPALGVVAIRPSVSVALTLPIFNFAWGCILQVR
jgi:sodium-coupled neutral amino acid transporter 11